MPEEIRLVKDERTGGQTPYHAVELGDSEALCGKDVTAYTYAVFKPSVMENGDVTAICDSCQQIYKEDYGQPS